MIGTLAEVRPLAAAAAGAQVVAPAKAHEVARVARVARVVWVPIRVCELDLVFVARVDPAASERGQTRAGHRAPQRELFEHGAAAERRQATTPSASANQGAARVHVCDRKLVTPW